MRFDRIHIPAFGPFTDLDLLFPAGGSDLQVIFGPNEAGKSSLLRAFRDLLFGVPGNTADNFVHAYKLLRIRGEIVSRAGERLAFQRRKGNANTLLDEDGDPIPENSLTRFLGGVDQDYFTAMFGLGPKELREGARQLLSGRGDIGQALFSASMGGTPVQRVIEGLVEESEQLHKGRSSSAKVTIRPSLKRYKELMDMSRAAAVKPETWENLEKGLAEAERSGLDLDGRIMALKRDLEWVARCEDALPTIGRLDEEKRKLGDLPALPEVAGGFTVRAQSARKAAEDARADVNRISTHISSLEVQLSACRIDPGLEAQFDSMESLHQGLGVYKANRKSLMDLGTDLAGYEAALKTGMQSMGLSGGFSTLETRRLASPLRLACDEAAANLQQVLEAREKNEEKRTDLEVRIREIEAQLEAIPTTGLTALRDVLAEASGATEANRTLPTAESDVKRLTREVEDSHRELKGAPADFDVTGRLPVPTGATMRRFGEEMDGLKRDIRTEEARVVDERRRIESLRGELELLELRGRLPSERDLKESRARRDHGWDLVVSEWKGTGSTEEFVSGKPLEEAYPEAVEEADRVADQLRHDAESVAQAEEKRSQIAQAGKQILESEAAMAGLRSSVEKCRAAWESEWSPCRLTPRTPSEMEEWRESWSRFRELLRQLRVAEETLQSKGDQVLRARRQLAGVLGESEEKEFQLLFEKVRKRLEDGEKARGKREQLADHLNKSRIQLQPLEQERARLESAVEAATWSWASQCRSAGIPEGLPPKSGLSFLQEQKDLLSKFDRWREADARSRKLNEDLRVYEQAVSEIAALLGTGGETTEGREAGLWKALTEARATQARRQQLSSQIRDAANDLEERKASHAAADAALREILVLAGIDTVEELEPILASLESRDRAKDQEAVLRDILIGLARGKTVDEFIEAVKAEDPESLPGRKVSLRADLAECEGALQEVRGRLADLKRQKAELEAAGDAAADHRQQAESCAARVRQDASRFIRLRLAVHFLQAQVERFREENQGPLLTRSGEIFQSITRGAFHGLKAEFGASDTAVLVGQRPDRSTVTIEGMSDGTRDQLYLSLRMAALEKHLERHEPMPLIMDDLLITCDNERAAAILPELARLAGQTQVLLFTHHRHLVELCRETLGDGNFQLHELLMGSPSLDRLEDPRGLPLSR